MLKRIYIFIILLLLSLFLYFAYFSQATEYSKAEEIVASSQHLVAKEEIIIHLETPEPLKGVYMTSCIASLPVARSKMVDLIEETELNAVVIDIKDYTGVVSFETGNSEIDKVSQTG